jgi:MtN3 and saliva related transmembrane protein
MYALTVVGFALWTTFGILNTEWPIVLTNSICFCLSAYILIRKIRAICNANPSSRQRSRSPNEVAGKAHRRTSFPNRKG